MKVGLHLRLRKEHALHPVGFRICLGLFLLCCFAQSSSTAEPDIRRDAAVDAVEKVLPCVVNIATETVLEYHEWYDDLLRQFYGWPNAPVRQQKSISLGSGVIIDKDGYVLTNFHVVHRASRIQVKLWDNREYDADPIVATPGSDVALLKLRSKPGEKFQAIRFASDDDLLLGETVLALGNPYGLGGSVTKGILSSKNRRPSTGNEPLNVEDWLQTDAAINPGNSGGPLVNLRGELIGLNVAVYREQHGERGMGVGFSIPVKQVSAALSRFFTPEVTDSLWFGAQVKAGPGPLKFISVQPGSPADQAGLREGDRVVLVAGQEPNGLLAFNKLLTGAEDHRAQLVISRGEERKNITVHLLPFDDLIHEKLGLTLAPLTDQAARRFGIRVGEGLLIEDVEKQGPADQAKLQRGCLLAGIEGQGVPEVRAAAEILAGKSKGDPVELTIVAQRRLGAGYFELRQGNVKVQVR